MSQPYHVNWILKRANFEYFFVFSFFTPFANSFDSHAFVDGFKKNNITICSEWISLHMLNARTAISIGNSLNLLFVTRVSNEITISISKWIQLFMCYYFESHIHQNETQRVICTHTFFISEMLTWLVYRVFSKPCNFSFPVFRTQQSVSIRQLTS